MVWRGFFAIAGINTPVPIHRTAGSDVPLPYLRKEDVHDDERHGKTRHDIEQVLLPGREAG